MRGLKKSSHWKDPVKIFASTPLLIIFCCKLRAVAKLWLVDISLHNNWYAGFQLQYVRWHPWPIG